MATRPADRGPNLDLRSGEFGPWPTIGLNLDLHSLLGENWLFAFRSGARNPHQIAKMTLSFIYFWSSITFWSANAVKTRGGIKDTIKAQGQDQGLQIVSSRMSSKPRTSWRTPPLVKTFFSFYLFLIFNAFLVCKLRWWPFQPYLFLYFIGKTSDINSCLRGKKLGCVCLLSKAQEQNSTMDWPWLLKCA